MNNIKVLNYAWTHLRNLRVNICTNVKKKKIKNFIDIFVIL